MKLRPPRYKASNRGFSSLHGNLRAESHPRCDYRVKWRIQPLPLYETSHFESVSLLPPAKLNPERKVLARRLTPNRNLGSFIKFISSVPSKTCGPNWVRFAISFRNFPETVNRTCGSFVSNQRWK